MNDDPPAKPERSAAQDYSIGIAIALVVLAAVALAWVVSGENKTAAAEGLEPGIADHFAGLLGGEFTADCPDGVKTDRGDISDCTVTRVDTGRSSPVFVTALDGDGHYSFQAQNPAALAAP